MVYARDVDGDGVGDLATGTGYTNIGNNVPNGGGGTAYLFLSGGPGHVQHPLQSTLAAAPLARQGLAFQGFQARLQARSPQALPVDAQLVTELCRLRSAAGPGACETGQTASVPVAHAGTTLARPLAPLAAATYATSPLSL